MAEDDYCKSYYYRGVADNWVDFAGFYWRIIRINGDGSIRLIYSGTKTNNTGEATQIGTSYYNQYYKGEKYVDYKISNIKTTVDNWYKTNILDKGYDGKVADTGYCNDMTKYDKDYFSSFYRLRYNKAPTLKCPNKANNLLLKSNNKLTYPVGLLTWDELSVAGGEILTNNKKYYLNTGKRYWTMTPARFMYTIEAYVGLVDSLGKPYLTYATETIGVRPALSLKHDFIITSGDGTAANPYRVG